ncbi:MAG TPA: VIT1/CCC1 transporter family protein [Edaphocola sp.]|nr:VIT1/CCC1 transporter family protein [Edaphocola sp.]
MALDSNQSDLAIVNYFTGIGDGLVLPFIAGTMVFLLTTNGMLSLLILAVTAILGAVAFGLGRYFGEIAEIEHHHPVLSAADARKEQEMMDYVGIDHSLVRSINEDMAREKNDWLKEIKDNELNWELLSKVRARKGGWQTGLGFFSGAALAAVAFFTAIRFYPGLSLRFFFCGGLFVLVLSGIAGGWKANFKGRPFLKGALYSLVYSAVSLVMPAVIVYFFVTR